MIEQDSGASLRDSVVSDDVMPKISFPVSIPFLYVLFFAGKKYVFRPEKLNAARIMN